ncbi:hypothetical protein [Hydrogeniiclostridium mannosilyticum]|nr:hypothetical protein [Hydrogeniiclostridium mannosilyticum]
MENNKAAGAPTPWGPMGRVSAFRAARAPGNPVFRTYGRLGR